MRFLEVYGRRRAAYEGTVAVRVGDGEPLTGYFEATQATDGTIAVGCFLNEPPFGLIGRDDIVVEGNDGRGWHVSIPPPVFATSVNTSHSRYGTTRMVLLAPNRMRFIRMPNAEASYSRLRFAVANLVIDAEPGAVMVAETNDVRVDIRSLTDYPERFERLRALSGVEHTADLELLAIRGPGYTLDEAVEMMNRIVSGLRLARGNRLDWLQGEGFPDQSNEPWEIIYKNPVIAPYSGLFRSSGWGLDLPRMVEAILSYRGTVLSIEDLRKFVDYFADTCSSVPYLELRALSAATLLDALLAKYTERTGQHAVMPQRRYQRQVLRPLRDQLGQLGLSEEERAQIALFLVGGYRTSFGRRLDAMNADLDLGIGAETLGRISRARNELVHTGSFPGNDRSSWFLDYRSLVWTNLAALSRLLGYAGDLPRPPDELDQAQAAAN